MHIILTHENADFDAVASLLGAALLYPEAVAVVPPVTNQNVRDFLTLYWSELPFVMYGDRPKERIDQITVVDAQYIPRQKGQHKKTGLRIIDHHTPGEHVPANAERIQLETGATVTYLTEELARTNIKITPLHATLLLLGIYEDCGSLTYSSTTPRDIRAAAWLLEHGAQLDILQDFLYYPLNAAQRELYHKVLKSIEANTIYGNEIMISAVQSDERVAEISSIAHKLRDLYNPDGLFLIVDIESEDSRYIQLIARSTTDTIHVGQIAERFGGGGHPRAAAAHIEGRTLAEVQRQLLTVLHELVRPATTVRQIMSFTARTLTADQTVREAAEMMTRYGHEGYPVVKDDRIYGIITRREIDRAMHHRLGGAAVEQFMHQGEIYVSPDDTIEALQKIMLREEIGQVPVVEDGKIIGIVTRTDLINLWSASVEAPARRLNLADRLAANLPPPLLDLLKEAGQAATQIGSSLYLVGGFVRDLLLEIPSLDIDLVVEGDAIALAQAMQTRYGGHVHSHHRFGTANWMVEGAIAGIDRLDFVTARTEFYRHPTALPEVEQSSIKQDLHRRDFTINTLAICLDSDRYGDLLDFYGGYHDLQAGRIRVLHSLSFIEDPTRILRAIRLEQRLDFQIGQRTLAHLKNAIDLIPRVTPDRIFSEIEYTLKEARPEKALQRLDELGVLTAIQAHLHADGWFATRCQQLRTQLPTSPWADVQPDTVHYLGLLTFPLTIEEVEAFNQRLRIRNNQARVLIDIQKLKDRLAMLSQSDTPSRLYRLLSPLQEEALLVCWIAFDDAVARERLAYFSRDLRHVQPLINGNYLIEKFELRPSPLFQEILTRLRDARLDGQVVSLTDEHQLVQALLANSD